MEIPGAALRSQRPGRGSEAPKAIGRLSVRVVPVESERAVRQREGSVAKDLIRSGDPHRRARQVSIGVENSEGTGVLRPPGAEIAAVGPREEPVYIGRRGDPDWSRRRQNSAVEPEGEA